MRQPKPEIGWLFPYQLLGLTNTPDDKSNIPDFQETLNNPMLEAADKVSIILNGISTIETGLPGNSEVTDKINWLLADSKKFKNHISIQGIRSKYATGVREALRFLNNVEEDYAWGQINADFFPQRNAAVA